MKNSFILFKSNERSEGNAALYADIGDWDGVQIALGALQTDIEMVVGVIPELVSDAELLPKTAIIVGTIGKSRAIDKLVATGKIELSRTKGKWESYLMEVVEAPFANVERALVVAGSDKRGTIYGIYEISRMIGVTPWVWWGDSMPNRKDKIAFPNDLRILQGEPSVKYRGFFLNDEAPGLSGWMAKNFPKVANPQAHQGCGHEFYTKVFELLLRLRGNYLWPTMWNNSFHTDDPQNTILADRYGVVMGTSHHEHMTCADKEWNWSNLDKICTESPKKSPEKCKCAEWNYHTNRDNIKNFWLHGTQARQNYESIITLGMRGQLDTSILGPNATLEDNMNLMRKVLSDQREIIESVYGKPDAVPQMLALYKEVEAFYYGDDVTGRLDVPDDVTLMLCDDNHGNLRTLPTSKRSGGYGMYYHFDYRGGPISYQWINQTPLPKIWDNMTKAYDAGIREIWIVNVGDLKPMEFPLDYFMTLAYDYEAWSKPNKTALFTMEWASREFIGTELDHNSDENIDIIKTAAEVISGHLKILGARKAEVVHSSPSTFGLTAFDEANRVLDNFETIITKGESVYDSIPKHKKDAFYQMVLYPARASMNVYKTQIYAAWSLYYAEKKQPIANKYAQMSKEAFEKNSDDTEYYNKTLSNGKWNGIMRQNHMGYTKWDSAKTHVVPNEMPVVGEANAECRMQNAELTEEASNQNKNSEFRIPNSELPIYIETNGYVSINPSRFFGNSETEKGKWVVIDDYGREFDSIKVLPNNASFENGELSPTITYSFYLQTPGSYSANVFLVPANNPYHHTIKPLNEQLRFAVQFDDGDLLTASGLPDELDVGYGGAWAYGVMNNARVVTIPHGYLSEGLHQLHIHAVDCGVTIQKIVIAPPNAMQTIIASDPPTEQFMDSYYGPPESFFMNKTRKVVDNKLDILYNLK